MIRVSRTPLLQIFLFTIFAIFLAFGHRANAQTADVLPPVLTAVSVDNAVVTGGDTQRLRYTASDASGIVTVHMVFTSPTGHQLTISGPGEIPGVIDFAVDQSLANGRYELDSVIMVDGALLPNSVVYYRDGRVQSDSPGAPTTHGLDLSVLDFTISGNTNADTAPPVLTAALAENPQVSGGDTLRLRYTASDANGIVAIHMVFTAPTGQQLTISGPGETPGLIDFAVEQSLENGEYELASIIMFDGALMPNSVTYYRDGRVESGSPGAPTMHNLDLSGLDFTISGNADADTLPPVLQAVSLNDADLVAGEVLQLRYTANDASGIGTVHIVFQTPDGRQLWVSGTGDTPGVLDLTIPGTVPDGAYTLDRVNMFDRSTMANSVSYYRDGRVESASPGAPTTHAIDLTVLDFTVTGNELRVDIEDPVPDENQPVEIEVTPVDGEGLSAAAPLSTGSEIYVSTTLGSLTSGAASGARVRAVEVAPGRYVAQLRSGQAGTAAIRAEIGGRILPTLNLTFTETRPAPTVGLAASAGTITQGEELRLTATVTAPGGGAATGMVVFQGPGGDLGRVALAGGRAELATRQVPSGSAVELRARYEGSSSLRPVVSAPITVRVNPGVPVAFAGGGAVFGLTEACGVQGIHPVRVSYSPSELNGGPPSQVSIVWPTGSEHISLWGPMAPSAAFQGAAGRGMWSRFVFYPMRPLVRVVQRQILQPAGADLAQAQDMVLRLRIQSLFATPGCVGVLAATLRRQD